MARNIADVDVWNWDLEDKPVVYDTFVPLDKRDTLFLNYLQNDLRDINLYLKNILGLGELPQPTVILSDEIKKKRYGKLNPEEVLAELDSILDSLGNSDYERRVKEIIERIKDLYRNGPDDECIGEVVGSLLDDISTLQRDLDTNPELGDNPLNRVLDTLGQCIVNTVTLGEYIPARHQIIIYFEAIALTYPNNFKGNCSLVLAHEYFHSMHYADHRGKGLWTKSGSRNDRRNKTDIIEAMADAFAVIWCNDRIDGHYFWAAKDRFDCWKRYFLLSWPYAKALYIYKLDAYRFPRGLLDFRHEDIVDKLKAVYMTSEKSPSEAYKIFIS